jgi:serine/threonine protein kinase
MVDTQQLIQSLPNGSKIIGSEYILMETLGEGKFSKVKLAKCLSKNLNVAIKIHKDMEHVDQVGLKKEIEILS